MRAPCLPLGRLAALGPASVVVDETHHAARLQVRLEASRLMQAVRTAVWQQLTQATETTTAASSQQ